MTLNDPDQADGNSAQASHAAHAAPAVNRELALGIDTGGTFTDAVLLADGRRVVATAKALTTHWNLAIGIGNAIRAVLAERCRRSASRR
jgi:activator of 2-hydroxyglutaryl-CoA dehydratase